MTTPDPNFRPANLFWPLPLRTHILATVKGAERREAVERYLDGDGLSEVPAELLGSALSEETRKYLGSLHPSLMGGEYLPDHAEGELEVARVTLASTMQDVVSVYARRDEAGLAYRVVDEYEGDTLTGNNARVAPGPLSLRELTDFLLGAWDLFGVLEMNFADGGDECCMDFFHGSSAFYPDFGAYLEGRVRDRLQDQAE
jgi:hypothetical protein